MLRIIISCIVFGAVVLSCSTDNRSKLDAHTCLSLLDSINLDQVIGLTDLSVNWRNQTLLFWIQMKKDSSSIPFYIKDNKGELLIRNNGRDLNLNNLNIYGSPAFDSIYLQKDRIKYCYFLMNKYPFKEIKYIARKKMVIIEIDTFRFVNIRDSSYLSKWTVDL